MCAERSLSLQGWCQEVSPEASEAGSHASTGILEDADNSDPLMQPAASSVIFWWGGYLFSGAPSAEYIKELHTRCADVKAFS